MSDEANACTTCATWGRTITTEETAWGIPCPDCGRLTWPNLGVNCPAGSAVSFGASATTAVRAALARGEGTTPVTEQELARVRDLLRQVPAGPWRWAYKYGLRDGLHWCLESDESAKNGCCLDHHLVTHTRQQFQTREDMADPQVPLSDLPLWRFLADSRETVAALLGAVAERDGVIHDLQLDSEAYRLGRATELGGVLATLAHLRDEQRENSSRWEALAQAAHLIRTRHELTAAEPLPPDRARAEIDRQRRVLAAIASAAADDLPEVAAMAREALGE